MIAVRVCYARLQTSWKSIIFTNKVRREFSVFCGGVFNKTIIPLALVGYEMITGNEARSAELAIYYLISNAHS